MGRARARPRGALCGSVRCAIRCGSEFMLYHTPSVRFACQERRPMLIPTLRRVPLSRVLRIIRARPRLILSVLLGLAMPVVLPGEWRAATRGLVGWDIGVGLCLVLAFRMMSRSDVSRIR